MSRSLLIISMVLSFACNKDEKKKEPSPTAKTPVETQAATPAPPAAARPAATEVLPANASHKDDLDGDGVIEGVLVEGDTLTIGKLTIKHPATPDNMELRIVDIDKTDKFKEVAIFDLGVEDDATLFLFAYDGSAITPSPTVFVGNIPESFDGSGNFETSSYNCGEVTKVVWALSGRVLEKKSETKSGKYKEEECAACPFVYVRTEEGMEFSGEILRNVVGFAARTRQSLALPAATPADDGLIEIRIAERKPEVSYIDSLELRVGGQVFKPRQCSEAERPSYCAADGFWFVLPQGDHVDLEFDVGSAKGKVVLWASGYYERML